MNIAFIALLIFNLHHNKEHWHIRWTLSNLPMKSAFDISNLVETNRGHYIVLLSFASFAKGYSRTKILEQIWLEIKQNDTIWSQRLIVFLSGTAWIKISRSSLTNKFSSTSGQVFNKSFSGISLQHFVPVCNSLAMHWSIPLRCKALKILDGNWKTKRT